MTRRLIAFWTDTRGTTAIEYGLIASCISVVIMVAGVTIGSGVGALFAAVAAAFK